MLLKFVSWLSNILDTTSRAMRAVDQVTRLENINLYDFNAGHAALSRLEQADWLIFDEDGQCRAIEGLSRTSVVGAPLETAYLLDVKDYVNLSDGTWAVPVSYATPVGREVSVSKSYDLSIAKGSSAGPTAYGSYVGAFSREWGSTPEVKDYAPTGWLVLAAGE